MTENTVAPVAAGRRVLLGINDSGESTVVSDARQLPSTQLPNGIVLQELWQQRSLPAGHNDAPEPAWTLGPDAPEVGVVVRILTVPIGFGADEQPDLHTDPSLHVITMLSGELVFPLQDGEVTLAAGESIVLRDSMHDLRNTGTLPATFVYTSFPLARNRHDRASPN